MSDRIYSAFLTRQQEEGLALADASDLLELIPLGSAVAQNYLARFRCNGLIRSRSGAVETADRFEVAIRFPTDYLRRVDPFQILTWLGPRNVFHPNISDVAPVICLGRVTPGTPLVDLVYQCYEIITYNKVTMREDDALNKTACAWARKSHHRFPVDARPLKRRSIPSHTQITVREKP